MLWTNTWHDRPLKDEFPQLHSFARKTKYSTSFFLEKEVHSIFSSLSPCKHLTSSTVFRLFYKKDILKQKGRTNGSTNGALANFPQEKHTKKLLEHSKHLHFSNGSGLLATWVNTSSSSGSFLETDLTQEIF